MPMLNNLPSSTSITEVLDFVSTLPRYSERNRALFACRLELRIKDICLLTVGDILLESGVIKTSIVSKLDGRSFSLSTKLREELERYLRNSFSVAETTLKQLFARESGKSLFSTQKAARFTANTLAQHFSLLDKQVHAHFISSQRHLVGRQKYLADRSTVSYSSCRNTFPSSSNLTT